MKTTTLSSKDFAANFVNCESLGDILRQLELDFQVHGEVICEVRVNGLFFSEAEEKAHAATPIADIQELSVGTETPERLVASTIESMFCLIPQVKKESLNCSELFRNGGDVEKQVRFSQVLEGSQWISDALFLIKQNIFEVIVAEQFRSRWAGLEVDFGTLVKEILKSFESKNYILLADLLEYELPTLLEGWEKLIADEVPDLSKVYPLNLTESKQQVEELEEGEEFVKNISC